MKLFFEKRVSILLLSAIPAVSFGFQSRQPPSEEFDLTPQEVAGEQHYRQPLRPQFHYTPIQGHIGDATGLIYYRGEYHLFNMYDEWSRRRLAHKRWGHAISSDLIHWQQMPPVLDTLLDNKPGSGSGVVDWNNSSGFRRGGEQTLLIYYTDYKTGTCIAISHDRGRTWTRYGKNPVIAGAEDARDPTVFWYAPAGEWRMVRYEKKGFVFYKSSNLLEWTWLSRLDGFYECPDLVELPILNRLEERRWVLIDGNAEYLIGKFDGTRFAPETGKLKVDYGKALYAGQVWKRTLEGGPPAYQMFWMRYPNDRRLTWNGQMSFPVELTLWAFPEGIRLCRKPIDEINNLRVSEQTWRDITVNPGGKPLDDLKAGLLDLRAEMRSAGAAAFGMIVRGQPLRYSVADQTLSLGQAVAPLKLADGKLRLQVLIDRSSVEVFADRGQVTLSAITLDDIPAAPVKLVAEGGAAQVDSLRANHLESIWQAK